MVFALSWIRVELLYYYKILQSRLESLRKPSGLLPDSYKQAKKAFSVLC